MGPKQIMYAVEILIKDDKWLRNQIERLLSSMSIKEGCHAFSHANIWKQSQTVLKMMECWHKWRNLSTGYRIQSQPANPSLGDNINYKYCADWDAVLMRKFKIPGKLRTAEMRLPCQFRKRPSRYSIVVPINPFTLNLFEK